MARRKKQHEPEIPDEITEEDMRITLTPNQIVAYNLAQARLWKNWTQEEAAEHLAPYLGTRWSKASFSAAERSVDGQRVRQFTRRRDRGVLTGLPAAGRILLPSSPAERRTGAGSAGIVGEPAVGHLDRRAHRRGVRTGGRDRLHGDARRGVLPTGVEGAADRGPATAHDADRGRWSTRSSSATSTASALAHHADHSGQPARGLADSCRQGSHRSRGCIDE